MDPQVKIFSSFCLIAKKVRKKKENFIQLNYTDIFIIIEYIILIGINFENN